MNKVKLGLFTFDIIKRNFTTPREEQHTYTGDAENTWDRIIRRYGKIKIKGFKHIKDIN